jgi:DNA-binding transcriptional ArsR family regulator
VSDSGTSDSDRVFALAAELFGLLSAPIRFRIVCELLEGEQNVGQLAERIGASRSNLSQHLATLYRCGILARRRVGAQVWYRIANDRVRALCEAVRDGSKI